MFIYEFMGGIADTITGGEDEETYDPHQHRKVEKPTSYSETMMHLLKGSVGAGILAMPAAMSHVGVFLGVLGLSAIGLLATYCIHLLIAAQYEICRRHRRGYMSYGGSMRAALQAERCPRLLRRSAHRFGRLVDLALVVWQLGLCTVYIVFVASNIKQVSQQVVDRYTVSLTLRTHILILLPPLAIINMTRDLKLLTPLSTISNALTMLGLMLVFFYLIEDDVKIDQYKLFALDLEGIPLFIGMTLFAIEAVGVILALEYNMENPKQFVGFCGLFDMGMTIILVLYALVGVFGYLKYGDQVEASLTLSLPEEEKKAQAAKVILAVAIFLTYPLQNYVAYTILWRRLRKMFPNVKEKIVDIPLRVLLVLVPWSIAWCVPRLGPFISLFGALCLSPLALVFPAILDACLVVGAGGPRGGGARRRGRLLRDFFITVAGSVCFVAGIYTSIGEIFEDNDESSDSDIT